jgi:hypothetical protein
MTQVLNSPASVSGYGKALVRQQNHQAQSVPYAPEPNRRHLGARIGSVLRAALLLPPLLLALLLILNGLVPVLVVAVGLFLPVLLPFVGLALAALGHEAGVDCPPGTR